MSSTIKVSNLHPDITKADMTLFLSGFGQLANVIVDQDSKEKCTGTALVTFKHPDGAKQAVRRSGTKQLLDQDVIMEPTDDPTTKPSNLDEVLKLLQSLSSGDKTTLLQALSGDQSSTHGAAPGTPGHHGSGHPPMPYIIVPTSTPRLSWFSGTEGEKKDKSETTYQQWRHEVEGLQAEHTHPVPTIINAIRKSLKMPAARVLQSLEECTRNLTVEIILQKFDKLFGNVLPDEDLFERFYTAHQKEAESVAMWSCRLEELIALIQSSGAVDFNTAQKLLRSKFWTGLTVERIKLATRHKYDSDNLYEDLVVAARRVEQETSSSSAMKKTAQSHQMQQDPMAKKIDQMMKQLESLTKQVKEIQSGNRLSDKAPPDRTRQSWRRPQPPRGTCWDCQQTGHYRGDPACPGKPKEPGN
jgi:hypothetical protein